jgi:hypothetical protein
VDPNMHWSTTFPALFVANKPNGVSTTYIFIDQSSKVRVAVR